MFIELGINSSLINKLKERSISKPTAIQSLVIPALLEGKNIIFRSATGTGKTFAYLLPVLQRILEIEKKYDKYQQGPEVVICTPTLELCTQIKGEIDFLSTLPSLLLTGSVKIEKQVETIKKTKPVIVVGNPSRLLALVKIGKLKFNSLKYFIFDEADKLTVPENYDETKQLLSIIEKEQRHRKKTRNLADNQTQPENRGDSVNHFDSEKYFDSDKLSVSKIILAACSATVGIKTKEQLGTLFETAEIIVSEDNEILREKIEHWAIFSEKRRKVQTLRSLLSAMKNKKSKIKVLIFTSKTDDAAVILSQLQYHHIAAAGLIGKLGKKAISAADRKEALDLFRQGSVDVLISTDLAARGLDIPNITHVVSLDVPDGDGYIHRCGRTGRAGKHGVMITIGNEVQMRLLSALEKKLKIKIYPKELYQGMVCTPELE